jgi:integrase/recombinase XerD
MRSYTKRSLRRKPRLPARSALAQEAAANGLRAYQRAFVEWTQSAGLSEETAKLRSFALDHFIVWCDTRGLDKPPDITKPILESYQRYLYHYRKKNGEPLTFATQVTRMNPLKAFFKWLAQQNYLLYNPASELVLPRLAKRLPKYMLTERDVSTIINQVAVATPIGVRDRAILETLYSTGMRRMELTHLKTHEVDVERGSALIRQGKGKKDRMVPIGDRACAWIAKYLAEARPLLVAGADEGALFLTDYGEPFAKNRLGDLVRRYVERAELGKVGACHLLRHACATHMLENGADIRYIQALLGHSDLASTQIYTQVSIGKLKEIHAATHPARLQRSKPAAEGLPSDDQKQALLDTLEGEAEGDED